MRIFNFVFLLLFVLFALVQYNDPDPWLWIALYLYGALLCLLAARNINSMTLNVLGAGVYLAYAAYLFASENGVWSWLTQYNAANLIESMQATKPWIEKTREFFGLIILLAVLLINMFRLGRRSSPVQ